MNARTNRLRLESVFSGAFIVLALVLCQPGCDHKTPAPAKTELIPLTNMVAIKAGTFMRIKFPVTLTRDFWIGKYEVTQGEFTAVLGRNPSHSAGGKAHFFRRQRLLLGPNST
jgi:hypothetical protein